MSTAQPASAAQIKTTIPGRIQFARGECMTQNNSNEPRRKGWICPAILFHRTDGKRNQERFRLQSIMRKPMAANPKRQIEPGSGTATTLLV